MAAIPRYRRPANRALFSAGFRPFFLAAGLWAAIGIAIWIFVLNTGAVLPSRFDPLSWHIHEMLFGFVMAAVAGFLLTAIPNWTRRMPVRGAPLAALASLWLLGRIVCLISLVLPAWLAIAADLAFPLGLLAVVAREIVAGRNWRNLPMVAPVAVLTIANLLMHLEANGVAVSSGLGWRLALAAVLILVSVIGGHIVPSFTRNWLVAHQVQALPFSSPAINRAALGTMHAGMIGWAFFPDQHLIGIVLIAAAIFNLWRLVLWRGVRTMSEPLLLILHIGYAWLAVGAGVLGASMLTPAAPQSAGVHTMTVGAIGTMILAVMTRATRGHTGRALMADGATSLLYGFVIVALGMRIAAAFVSSWTMPLLIVAASFWVAAFGIFILHYGPMLVRPREGMTEGP